MQFVKLFNPGPFYSADYELNLPELDIIKLHFNKMIEVYRALESILDESYTKNDKNLWIVLGYEKGTISDTLNSEEYNKYHKEFQDIRNYYQMLLLAVKRKYSFWLNDLLPEEPKKRKTRKK